MKFKTNLQKTAGFFFSIVLFCGISAHAADTKIGYVDLQKAIQSTSAGKQAKEQLEKEFQAKQKELKEREQDLKERSQDLEKGSMAMTEEVRQDKQRDLQRKMMEYRERVGQSRMAIQQKEQQLTAPIIKDLRKILEEVAQEKEYTMVLEKSEQSVLWAKQEVDLTDEVVKIYEKRKKEKKN